MTAMVCDVSNDAFLRAVFGGDWQRAHVCAFAGDPRHDGRWMGTRWGRLSQGERDIMAGQNAYFCISTFRDEDGTGIARRRADLFEACYCVVVDDVGTKVDPEDRALPAGPNWVLETSAGNFQWGYLLRPLERSRRALDWALPLLAKRLGEGGRDPGMCGVTRYARLPVGVNGKPGRDGFRTRLVYWDPRTATASAGQGA